VNDLGPLLVVLAAQITLPLAGALLSRRDPRPLAVALVAVIGLTGIVVVPRPSSSIVTATPTTATPDAIPSTPTESAPMPRGVNLLALLRLAPPTSDKNRSALPSAWSVVAWIALSLAAVGMMRFLWGIAAILSILWRSRPIADGSLLALADELRQRLGCRRAIALRESARVGSAATVGWIRPVILLSPTWRTWATAEARAALAHEIAHAARGDFVARLFARLAVALHGYHPLVHWTANALELCQELIADAGAAEVCGGRPAYLKCLASLALKADNRTNGLVPAFLSRPRILFRRIAMLRVTDDRSTSRRRWPAVVGVALLTAAALVLHGRAEPVPAPVAAKPPLSIQYVARTGVKELVGVFAIRVGELLKAPGMDRYAELIGGPEFLAQFGGSEKVHFRIADVEQISGPIYVRYEPKQPPPNHSMEQGVTSVRMVNDFDWLGQMREWCTSWKEHTHAGHKYYSGKLAVEAFGMKGSTYWFYLPDARTVVFESTEDNLRRLIATGSEPSPGSWAAVEGDIFGILVPDPKGAAKLLQPSEGTDYDKQMWSRLSEILSRSDEVVVRGDVGPSCWLDLTVHSRPGKATEAIAAACELLVGLGETARKEAAKEEKSSWGKASLTTHHGTPAGIRIEYRGSLSEVIPEPAPNRKK
jgi:beta-lactamase regulating signal transducer with metallopeptidase domain